MSKRNYVIVPALVCAGAVALPIGTASANFEEVVDCYAATFAFSNYRGWATPPPIVNVNVDGVQVYNKKVKFYKQHDVVVPLPTLRQIAGAHTVIGKINDRVVFNVNITCVEPTPVPAPVPVPPEPPPPKPPKPPKPPPPPKKVPNAEVAKDLPARTNPFREYRMQISVKNTGKVGARFVVIDPLPEGLMLGLGGKETLRTKTPFLKPGETYVWRPKFRNTLLALNRFVTNCVYVRTVKGRALDKACDTTYDPRPS